MSYYHQQYSGNMVPEQVVVESKHHREKADSYVRERPSWSWCSTGWAIFSIFCCFPWLCCNLLGLVFSLTAYTDHKTGDYPRSGYKKRCAWGCTVTAIILGLLTILAILLIVFISPWGQDIQDAFSNIKIA